MQSGPVLPLDAVISGSNWRLVWVLSLSVLVHGLLLWALQGLPSGHLTRDTTGGAINISLVRGRQTAEIPSSADIPAPAVSRPERKAVPDPDARQTDHVDVPMPVASEQLPDGKPRNQPRAATTRRRAAVTVKSPEHDPKPVASVASGALREPVTHGTQDTTGQTAPPVLSLSTTPGPAPAATRSPGIVPTYTPEPEYPGMARRLGLEGKVLLHVLMALNGIPEEVSVISSSGHPLLDKAAMKTIKSWRFSVSMPAGDIHEPPSIDIPIRFQLN